MEQPGTAGTANTATASKLSAAALAHAKTRGIGRATLERLGVASGMAFFPALDRKSEAMFFPYLKDGQTVNWKAAAFPEKAFTAMPGSKQIFFNLDVVLGSPMERIYITEGEWDVAALVESGVGADQVLSVPSGAREHAGGGGYGYVQEALEAGLGGAKAIIWCGDSDGPGRALREDMARIMGAARFWFVDWPEGTKDANEFLVSDGPAAVLDLVLNGALPWPVEGLYRLSELPEPAPMTLWDPGFPEWERKVMLAPKCLSVVTGHPGHGKTSLWMQIWYQVCRTYGLGACIASFETRAKPHHRRALRQFICGKLQADIAGADVARADKWIEDHFLWLQHPGQTPTLGWVLDAAEVAVIRHGVRIIQIDPWNQLEAGRERGETETEYVLRALRALYSFANDFSCHVQIIAHPAKMDPQRRGRPPLLEDIAGSKHWDNVPDQGFVIHRPKVFEDGVRRTEAVLYPRKARFEELGYPCKLALDYDLTVGAYRSADYKQAHES